MFGPTSSYRMPRQRVRFESSEEMKFHENKKGTAGARAGYTQFHSRSGPFHSGSNSPTATVRRAPFIAASSGIASVDSINCTHGSPSIITLKITNAA